MQVPHIVLLSCLSGTKLINENCVLTTLHISEFWLVRRHVATHSEQSRALEKHRRTPQRRIWSRSEIRNGSLPKFNGDFTVQRHINDKIFTKICSVFFPQIWAKLWKNALSRDVEEYDFQNLQDAQLSQRDRAAGCVIVFAKSSRLELEDNNLRTW